MIGLTVGVLMLVALFAGVFVIIGVLASWRVALVIGAISVAVDAWVLAAVWLLSGGAR